MWDVSIYQVPIVQDKDPYYAGDHLLPDPDAIILAETHGQKQMIKSLCGLNGWLMYAMPSDGLGATLDVSAYNTLDTLKSVLLKVFESNKPDNLLSLMKPTDEGETLIPTISPE
jgi:hypothetical protein